MNALAKFAVRVVVLAFIMYAVTRMVPGIVITPNKAGTLGSIGTYTWVALLFALVNSILGPIIRLLSLPFVVLTLGLFLLVINAALLGITAALSDRLAVDSAGSAIVGGFLIALFGWVAELLLPLKIRR